MQDLMSAIYTRLIEDAPPGESVFIERAPEGTAYPYVVLSMNPSSIEYHAASTVTIETVPVMVSIYDDKYSDVADLMDQIVEILNEGDFTLSKHISTYIISKQILVDPDRDSDGTIVYHAVIISESMLNQDLSSD